MYQFSLTEFCHPAGFRDGIRFLSESPHEFGGTPAIESSFVYESTDLYRKGYQCRVGGLVGRVADLVPVMLRAHKSPHMRSTVVWDRCKSIARCWLVKKCRLANLTGFHVSLART